MRWFFYLLVLANVGFLLWNVFSPVPVAVQPAIPVLGDRPIMLLSEAAPQQEHAVQYDSGDARNHQAMQMDDKAIEDSSPSLTSPVEQDEQLTEEAAPIVAQCMRLSNIATLDEQKALVEELAVLGPEILDKGSEPATKSNHWVMLPPAKNRDEAKETLAKLKNKGIKDYYLVGDGDNENAISLGVFSRPESAQRRVKQIQNVRLGLKPVVEEVILPATRYWINMRIANTGESPWEDVLKKRTELVVSQISCEK